jgi:hypothetical protein
MVVEYFAVTSTLSQAPLGSLQGKDSPLKRYYEMPVPAGEYQVWLERDGKAITDRKTLRVEDGKDMKNDFEYVASK